jgi:hypothetical protein
VVGCQRTLRHSGKVEAESQGEDYLRVCKFNYTSLPPFFELAVLVMGVVQLVAGISRATRDSYISKINVGGWRYYRYLEGMQRFPSCNKI